MSLMTPRAEIEILTTRRGIPRWESTAQFSIPEQWGAGDLIVDLECARLLHSPPQLVSVQLRSATGDVVHEHRHYLEEVGESGQLRLVRFTFCLLASVAILRLESADDHRRVLLGTLVATHLSSPS